MSKMIALAILSAAWLFSMAGCGAKREWEEPIDAAVEEVEEDTLHPFHDEDGDTIVDEDEGRNEGRDTDADTIPDYRDEDSDGDEITDSMERVAVPGEPPLDSDRDGKPDYLDLDSDNNGRFDHFDGTADSDGDGMPAYRDLDDDNDGMHDEVEIGDPSWPVDSDGDGTPDFLDTDSDGDEISDRYETPSDTDGDGIPNWRDLDSDRDGIPDKNEAGDTDLMTPPVDNDNDRVPDFLDRDSDADGLSDSWEHQNGTSPTNTDTDMDRVPDLIEVGVGTDPRDASRNPMADGNFVFVVPFREQPNPLEDTLVFTTEIQKADVYFMIDTSGSMREEIFILRDSLRDTVVPGIRATIPDVWFGVMRFEDCIGRCPHSIANLQSLTHDVTAVQRALNSITQTCGGSEPYALALYIVASGDSPPGLPPKNCPNPAASIGYPCFRSDSIPILMQLGDERFDDGTASCRPHKSISDAVSAINAIRGRYIGVNSGESFHQMVQVAVGTGSVDAAGNPLVFNIPSSGVGLGNQVIQAVSVLANQVPIEVSTTRRDDPRDGICYTSARQRTECCCTDAGGNPIACYELARAAIGPCRDGDTFEPIDASLKFIERIVPNVIGGEPDPANPAVVCVGGLETADMDGDGLGDIFSAVLPGTPVCFDIYPLINDVVEPLEVPQTFICEIDVVGDGITVLDTRRVYFLVPPLPIIDVPI